MLIPCINMISHNINQLMHPLYKITLFPLQLIYAATILTKFTWTSTTEPHVQMHRCSPPEDGSFMFRNMSGLFLYVILASINFV